MHSILNCIHTSLKILLVPNYKIIEFDSDFMIDIKKTVGILKTKITKITNNTINFTARYTKKQIKNF